MNSDQLLWFIFLLRIGISPHVIPRRSSRCLLFCLLVKNCVCEQNFNQHSRAISGRSFNFAQIPPPPEFRQRFQQSMKVGPKYSAENWPEFRDFGSTLSSHLDLPNHNKVATVNNFCGNTENHLTVFAFQTLGGGFMCLRELRQLTFASFLKWGLWDLTWCYHCTQHFSHFSAFFSPRSEDQTQRKK